MTMNVSMESQCAGRTIIDVCQPTLNHKNITDYLLVLCSDMMRYGIFGIEKTTSLKVLMGGHHLIERGQQEQMKTSWYLR